MSYRIKKRVLFMLDSFVVVGMLVTIILLCAVLGKMNTQVKNTHDDLQTSTARIENDMQCIQKFFSLENRQNLQIVDLPNCTIIDPS